MAVADWVVLARKLIAEPMITLKASGKVTELQVRPLSVDTNTVFELPVITQVVFDTATVNTLKATVCVSQVAPPSVERMIVVVPATPIQVFPEPATSAATIGIVTELKEAPSLVERKMLLVKI